MYFVCFVSRLLQNLFGDRNFFALSKMFSGGEVAFICVLGQVLEGRGSIFILAASPRVSAVLAERLLPARVKLFLQVATFAYSVQSWLRISLTLREPLLDCEGFIC